MKKIIVLLALAAMAALALVGCSTSAQVASYNLSKAADQFQVYRRVVFYNGITDKYILMVEGYCSVDPTNPNQSNIRQLSVTCKIPGKDSAPAEFVKHFFGLSDNSLWFVQQMLPSEVSTDQYHVIFKPSSILPHITTN